MITLRNGSRAQEVLLLQRLLNVYFETDRTVSNISEDGIFGSETDAMLRRFQRAYNGPAGRLTVDAVAGPSTWRALGLRGDIAWPVAQVGQSTAMSCWVVCAGLATGRMASTVPQNVRFDPINTSYADRRAPGGMDADAPNIENYARENNMRVAPGIPNSVEGILGYLRAGPAILVGVRATGGLHAVVITAAYVAARNSDSMIRISNPSPMGRGSTELAGFPTMAIEMQSFKPRNLIVK
ncbi:MAG: peptidoglycan-binding domain-containing protein [Paracoccaceae bacterium]